MLYHSVQGAGNLYVTDFVSFTFTTGGLVSSHVGPTLSQLLANYDTVTYPWLNDTTYFNSSNGIQLWTVPHNGMYTIDVYGSKGANASTFTGGIGARMQGDFYLNQGNILSIVVGQIGLATGYAGGGGASGVWVTGESTPLIIAGGGGGANSITNRRNGLNASISTSGVSSAAAGGTNGNGGAAPPQSGPGSGGGWYTAGSSGLSGTGGAALSLTALGGYAVVSSTAYFGGFGGAGAGFGGGGGGGGYSGGGGGNYLSSIASVAAGGGGGSINTGTNQVNVEAANNAVGKVIITRIG